MDATGNVYVADAGNNRILRYPSPLLQTGDLLLAVDGTLVNRFREVEQAAQRPSVKVTVWRNGAELTVDLATVALDGTDIDRIVRERCVEAAERYD